MSGYYNWGARIFVSWALLNMPDYEDILWSFTYHNVKTGRESTRGLFKFADAILLAERRREDGRYKNYEFYID